MDEIRLEPWEKIPDALKDILPIIQKAKYPEIPEEPEIGKYYRLYPKDCVASDGSAFHGVLKLGKEAGKVIVFFGGGGVSWNEYTAARPNNLFSGHLPDNFYFSEAEWLGDMPLDRGLCSRDAKNPFKDWTYLGIPYCTGDFHCGTGDFPYTAQDGTSRQLHHHGYTNAIALLRMAKQWVDCPEKLLIAGVSAGGFGVALMAEDVISQFPDSKSITCLVDSSLLLKDDWQRVAREVWRSPEHICIRLTGDNIMLDSYTALYAKYGDRIQYLFSSSVRDALLVGCQNAIHGDGKNLRQYDRESGEAYQKALQETCQLLIKQIPGIGLYIFNRPWNDSSPDCTANQSAQLTDHCWLNSAIMFEESIEDIAPYEWLRDALAGKIERIGLTLLD